MPSGCSCPFRSSVIEVVRTRDPPFGSGNTWLAEVKPDVLRPKYITFSWPKNMSGVISPELADLSPMTIAMNLALPGGVASGGKFKKWGLPLIVTSPLIFSILFVAPPALRKAPSGPSERRGLSPTSMGHMLPPLFAEKSKTSPQGCCLMISLSSDRTALVALCGPFPPQRLI